MEAVRSRAARSVQVFSFYLLLLGPVLLLVPNWFLTLFSLPRTDEIWIRVVGLLVVLLGYYYWRAASDNLTTFFRATVHARLTVLVVFAAFVAVGLAPPILLLFGVVDALAAAWTAWSLRRDAVGQAGS